MRLLIHLQLPNCSRLCKKNRRQNDKDYYRKQDSLDSFAIAQLLILFTYFAIFTSFTRVIRVIYFTGFTCFTYLLCLSSHITCSVGSAHTFNAVNITPPFRVYPRATWPLHWRTHMGQRSRKMSRHLVPNWTPGTTLAAAAAHR